MEILSDSQIDDEFSSALSPPKTEEAGVAITTLKENADVIDQLDILDELLRTQTGMEELKQAAIHQQEVINESLEQLANKNLQPNADTGSCSVTRQCPMCEAIFEISMEDLEQHVLEHFSFDRLESSLMEELSFDSNNY
jgi:hypothetical protein